MAKTDYIERVNEFIVPYLTKQGYELIKTEFVNEDGNYFLRLYIDLAEADDALEVAGNTLAQASDAAAQTVDAIAQAGDTSSQAEGAEQDEEADQSVSINDCVKVSRYLSKWLDKEDFIKETYTMEVCSKGFLTDSTSEDKQGEGV